MKEGDLFANRYFIRRMLGRGAFSEVYLALDQKTQKDVALKIYAPTTGLDDQDLQMFAHEFSIVMNINHQNLLKPTYFDDYDRHPYLVLPYCRNGNVKPLIGKISEPEAWRMLHDVASGLAWLHSMKPPIVHQDIKPDNIMRGNQGEYLITDFGVSTSLRSTLRRSTTVATDDYRSAGTTAYMAPERFGRENKPIMANDVYSLGATMFEMLTGDVPFGDLGGIVYHQGAELPEIDCNCSEQLKQVVERCLSKEPWNRPVASQLEEWAQIGLRGDKIDFGPKAIIPDDSKPNTPPDKATPDDRPTQILPRPETTPPKSNKPSKKGSNEAGRVAIAVLCIAIVIACIGVFITPRTLTYSVTGTLNGHEYVDLGLPSGVMWATCNVGANSPSDYGDYFAWGETTTKSSYTKDNSETYDKSSYDYDIGGDPALDAARANWGSTWRLPTWAEYQELIDNCTWKWTTRSGKKGYEVTSKKNGNSIFLPAAGWRDDSSLVNAGEDGNYWTSSPDWNNSTCARSLYFFSTYFNVVKGVRDNGLSVRPVSAPNKEASASSTIPPSTGNTKTTPASGTLNGHDYVDLGLSVMWATCNVGASSPEEYGDYYAWGETKTKSSYTTDNSKTYGKSSYDRDIGGDASLDAARANWGGTWRLPTEAEFKELIDNCTWKWTTQGGKNGYKVTSKKNGNSIFLPAASWRYGSSLDGAGEFGIFWSSSPDGGNSLYARSLGFDSSYHGTGWNDRYFGQSVRPVSGPSREISTPPDISSSTENTNKVLDTNTTPASGTLNGHDYVDLGLSVMWATCNVGANNSSDYGKYFAWGETTTKSSYTSDNSKTHGNSSYNRDIGGDPNLDAARANWGGSWRLPTTAEMQELIDNCIWTWTSQGGKNGYKVTSKKNGNSIFLPAAGAHEDSSHGGVGEHGFYWTSFSSDESDSDYAHGLPFSSSDFARALYFNSSDYFALWSGRSLGQSVRPVSGQNKKASASSTIPPSTSNTKTTPASGTLNGHDYIDLGLSVMWATCNVGASSPEEYGDYYAWGETKTKSSYTTDNSKTYGKSSYDRDIGGDTSLDAARANWRGSWRLPTAAEMQELIDNCTWTWTSQGGKNGYKVTSKKNGNSIFLPAAGERDGSSLSLAGEKGYYWTSSPNEGDSYYARYLDFSRLNIFFMYLNFRHRGRPVRPVSEPDNKTSASPTIPPSTGNTNTTPANGTLNSHDYVDLGLSVKWATCNVGASSPSDYGDYFAWGETTSKSEYTKENSKTFEEKKYNRDIGGDASLDAARANWRGSWRLPTSAEYQELIDNCTWMWTTQGGKKGYKVTSKKNGKSIFLPAAGERYGSLLYYAGENGYYWTSSPYGRISDYARGLYFFSTHFSVDRTSRGIGFPVRPVSE